MLFKYEDYKNRLQVRICDRYSKEDFLKNKIVTYHGDFAAYYSIILGIDSEGKMISSMILLDSLLEQWNVTVEQIHADAMVSTLNFGSILASLDGMIMRLVGDKPHRQTNLFNYPDAIHASDFETPMFCLTMLTSEAYTFVGGTGGVGSGQTCTTEAVAFCGTNQCASVSVNASDITCPNGITATVENSGTSKVKITFKTTATINAACEATIPIVVDGITMNKKFSFAVARTGNTGATGKGIKSTVVDYVASASNTTVPTSGWSTTIPSVSAGQFLWTRTTITYTDNTTSVGYSVAKQGATGATGTTGSQWYSGTGITGTSTTATIFANSGVANARANDMYLNTTTGDTYKCTVAGAASVAKWVYAGNIKGIQGDKGNTGATGNGISKAEITYAASSSNTTAPTSGWQSTPPSVSAGQYLWTKTVFTYTNGGTATQYSVAKQGSTGAAGADAISLTITSSNGTVFKNNTGSTVLTAHVWKGAVEQAITDAGVCGSLGSIKWYKVGSDTAIATAKTLTVSANDVLNSQAYICQLEG